MEGICAAPFVATPNPKSLILVLPMSFNSIRRRRECLKCGNRFTTYERLGDNPIIVVKSDGTTQVFDREKLYRGISIACAKRPNIPNEKKAEIIDDIEAELRAAGRLEIKSKDLGDIVLEHLRGLDDVAISDSRASIKIFKLLKSSAKHSRPSVANSGLLLYALHEQ